MNKKRALAVLLWFYSGWAVGAMVAYALGITPAIGPVLGLAGATFVGLDPLGAIWARPSDARMTQIEIQPGAASSVTPDQKAA